MKIAITGHTSGIGQAIRQWFETRNHITLGFSRSTGYDLHIASTIPHIVEACADSTVFINNAYAGMAQVNLLYALYDRWKDRDAIILSIGSQSADGIKNFRHPYAVHKAALDKAIEQLQNTKSKCQLINLRLGYVDTPRVSLVTHPKLSTSAVADITGWLISQPHITSLTMVP